MNKKAANIQTLQRLDQLEAQITQANEAEYITVDDIRNTIHQVADIVVELSKTIPAILAELKALAELIAKMTSDDPPADQVPPASQRSPSGDGGTPPAAAKKVASSKMAAKK